MFVYLRKKKISRIIAAIFSKYANKTALLLKTNGVNAATNSYFIDSSSNNLAITRNGTVTQGAFSPFSPSGWSASFNGTTHYCGSIYVEDLRITNGAAVYSENFTPPTAALTL